MPTLREQYQAAFRDIHVHQSGIPNSLPVCIYELLSLLVDHEVLVMFNFLHNNQWWIQDFWKGGKGSWGGGMLTVLS